MGRRCCHHHGNWGVADAMEHSCLINHDGRTSQSSTDTAPRKPSALLTDCNQRWERRAPAAVSRRRRTCSPDKVFNFTCAGRGQPKAGNGSGSPAQHSEASRRRRGRGPARVVGASGAQPRTKYQNTKNPRTHCRRRGLGHRVCHHGDSSDVRTDRRQGRLS